MPCKTHVAKQLNARKHKALNGDQWCWIYHNMKDSWHDFVAGLINFGPLKVSVGIAQSNTWKKFLPSMKQVSREQCDLPQAYGSDVSPKSMSLNLALTQAHACIKLTRMRKYAWKISPSAVKVIKQKVFRTTVISLSLSRKTTEHCCKARCQNMPSL